MNAAAGPRGIATVATLLLLLLSALLAAAWAQRSALSEIRSAGSELQTARAFEAAEAGLEWAQAMLGDNRAIGADCRPSAGPGASSFRSRFLREADGAGHFAARDSGAPGLRLQIACRRGAGEWACSCPADSAPVLATGDGPAFLVELAAAARPGSIDVLSTGCSGAARPCVAAARDRSDASARLRVTLAQLPALLTPPAAALTTPGSIDAATAPLGLHNADALSGGLAAHAGGAISGSALRVGSVPGAMRTAALLSGDASLASLSAAQFFARHFGADPALWQAQPGISRLTCDAGCLERLQQLLDADADVARIAVAGDLRIAQPLQIGSRARPVVLVIDGDLLLRGPVRIHGLIHARRMRWDGVAADAGALLQGAALLSEGYSGDGAPDLVYDPLLMQRLQRRTGSWVRIPGSWRDG